MREVLKKTMRARITFPIIFLESSQKGEFLYEKEKDTSEERINVIRRWTQCIQAT